MQLSSVCGFKHEVGGVWPTQETGIRAPSICPREHRGAAKQTQTAIETPALFHVRASVFILVILYVAIIFLQ